MDIKKGMLLQTAANLYRLGIEVDTARQRLKSLVDRGVPYESQEMLTAFQELQSLDFQWKTLEMRYLELKEEISKQ